MVSSGEGDGNHCVLWRPVNSYEHFWLHWLIKQFSARQKEPVFPAPSPVHNSVYHWRFSHGAIFLFFADTLFPLLGLSS